MGLCFKICCMMNVDLSTEDKYSYQIKAQSLSVFSINKLYVNIYNNTDILYINVK